MGSQRDQESYDTTSKNGSPEVVVLSVNLTGECSVNGQSYPHKGTALLIPCGYHFLGVCAPVVVDGYGYGQWVCPTPYLYPLLTVFYRLMDHGHVPSVGHFVLSPSNLQVMTYNPIPMWSR